MRRLAAYFVFAAIYGGLLLLAGFIADQFRSEALRDVAGWAVPFAAAPLALLAAMRLGSLSRMGIAASSTILATVMCLTTVAILIAIAVPAVGEPTLDYIASMFASYFTIGGWGLLLSFVLFVAAPLLWAVALTSIKASSATAAA
jgi:hypothetical protein